MPLQKTEEWKEMGIIIQILCLCTGMVSGWVRLDILLGPTDSASKQNQDPDNLPEKQVPNDLSAAFFSLLPQPPMDARK